MNTHHHWAIFWYVSINLNVILHELSKTISFSDHVITEILSSYENELDHFQKYFFPIYDKNSLHILLFCRLYKSNNVATDTFEVRYQMRMHLVKVILFHQIVRRHLYFQLNAQLSSLPDFLDCEHFFSICILLNDEYL